MLGTVPQDTVLRGNVPDWFLGLKMPAQLAHPIKGDLFYLMPITALVPDFKGRKIGQKIENKSNSPIVAPTGNLTVLFPLRLEDFYSPIQKAYRDRRQWQLQSQFPIFFNPQQKLVSARISSAAPSGALQQSLTISPDTLSI